MKSCQPLPQDVNQLLLKLYRLSQEIPVSGFQAAAIALLETMIPFDSIRLHTPSFLPLNTALQSRPLSKQNAGENHHSLPSRKFLALSPSVLDLPLTITSLNKACLPSKGLVLMADEPKISFMQWIALFVIEPDACHNSAEAKLLAQLAPHIMQALVLNCMAHIAQDESAFGGQQSLAITNLGGKVCYASPVFKSLLRAEWSGWSGEELPNVLLAHFLPGHERFKGQSLVVSRRSEHDFLFFWARPLCRADRLTPREHTIAKLMVTGATHKKIALLLQRSPATVRNHIQSIYTKLGIGNIACLIEELRLAH